MNKLLIRPFFWILTISVLLAAVIYSHRIISKHNITEETISPRHASGETHFPVTNKLLVVNSQVVIPAELISNGVDVSKFPGMVFSSKQYEEYAAKYHLRMSEVKTLLDWWKGWEFRGGDSDRKAYQVGLICIKNKLNYKAVLDLMGPGIAASCPDQGKALLYFYRPDLALSFSFDRSGNLSYVSAGGKIIK